MAVAVDVVNAPAWRKLRGRACAFWVHCDDTDFRAVGREDRCEQCQMLDRLELLVHPLGDIEVAQVESFVAGLDELLSDYLEGFRP